ncbi:hypothetical protein EDM54_07145 [Brevibacillus borstelensis]|jgi:hypothetical protein|nr:hypothetical protein X546_11255 [Brevibacillus borstelensis cifa_chp40]RNB64472.1 hypothetical protein EDM54_07145 [Brevibacillus borstelensis]
MHAIGCMHGSRFFVCLVRKNVILFVSVGRALVEEMKKEKTAAGSVGHCFSKPVEAVLLAREACFHSERLAESGPAER